MLAMFFLEDLGNLMWMLHIKEEKILILSYGISGK
jgi:hypothetical protein